MILYHGTDSKNLDSILKHGLLSRKVTGNKVYDGTFASNQDFTYLTRWNPVAHAYTIDENSPVIFKVDVDENELYPDEDFLERLEYMETGRKINPAEIDISQHKGLWRQSYNFFGNVAIKQVKPEQIIDHVVLNPLDFPYHCGLGAQGNQLINLDKGITFYTGDVVNKYIRRLELLFSKGWKAVKKEILKEKPSITLSLHNLLPPLKERIKVNKFKLDVLFKPDPAYNLEAYICDEWQENFPIKFPAIDDRFSKLVQIPHTFREMKLERI